MIRLAHILKQLHAEGSLPITAKQISRMGSVDVADSEPEDVRNFWSHHHEHPGTADGPAEPDTWDFDDDTESDPGLQHDDRDNDGGTGYEPV